MSDKTQAFKLKINYLSIHSFNKHLLGPYYVSCKKPVFSRYFWSIFCSCLTLHCIEEREHQGLWNLQHTKILQLIKISLRYPSHIFSSQPFEPDISDGIIDQLHVIFYTMDIYLHLLNQITSIKIYCIFFFICVPLDLSLEEQFSDLCLKFSWRWKWIGSFY